ncbi:hypothetical protein DSO57_1011317 [Entomophthora muscae]|uniref:Uncharacterized protein n=1 Tax=Entomophthora muscae TaxID=34485 RepID=A0ACC2T6F5_9FUNG|nr:hypothetical protein DSO57_1011317 [Entomophthora muscae]
MTCSADKARIMSPDYNITMAGLSGNLIQINPHKWLLSTSVPNSNRWISYELTRSRRGWSVHALDRRYTIKSNHPLESFQDCPLVAHLCGDDLMIHDGLHFNIRLLLCLSLCKIISLSPTHSPLVRLKSLFKWPSALTV